MIGSRQARAGSAHSLIPEGRSLGTNVASSGAALPATVTLSPAASIQAKPPTRT